jgi:hypothetical protein
VIRKYLFCGKQVFLSSKAHDFGDITNVTVCELLLPIKVFWNIEKQLKKLDYMVSANSDQIHIGEEQKKVFRECARYTINEKDRIFLNERSHV